MSVETTPVADRCGRLLALSSTRGARLSCALMCAAAFGGLLSQPARAELPPIKHVFVIVLENHAESETFGAGSKAPYLATNLKEAGMFIPNYYGIGHSSLDNYIAMISGQAPNEATRADCGIFSAIPGEPPLVQGQEPSSGCIYPNNVPVLTQQLEAKGLKWRSYDESMGSEVGRETATCGHPAIGAVDNTQGATATDQYATRHDPFMYFNSIIGHPELCNEHVVNLNKLPADLAEESKTANYSFITPDLCDDGHEATCEDGVRKGGLEGINHFLFEWVPKIEASAAFKKDGLLIITFDEGEGESTSCCGETAGPGAPLPGGNGPGGGKVGAVLLSPSIKPGTESPDSYNHYSMLASVEAIFGLSRLGCAANATPFGSDVFTENPSYSLGAAESTTPCYIAPPVQTQPKETTPAPVAKSTTPAPVCVASVLPRNPKGKLKPSKVFTGVAVEHSGNVASLSLTAVHAGRLKVVAYPKKGRARTLASSRKIAVCTPYSFKLPPGHGRLTIVATVGRASQTATLKY